MGVQGVPAPVKLKRLEGTNYMTRGSRKGRTLKSAPILGPVSSADDLGQTLIFRYLPSLSLAFLTCKAASLGVAPQGASRAPGTIDQGVECVDPTISSECGEPPGARIGQDLGSHPSGAVAFPSGNPNLRGAFRGWTWAPSAAWRLNSSLVLVARSPNSASLANWSVLKRSTARAAIRPLGRPWDCPRHVARGAGQHEPLGLVPRQPATRWQGPPAAPR